MKKYFYHDGQNQFGPFSPEELKEKKINRETHVWSEGMSDWQKAGVIDELKFLFAQIPPPINKTVPPSFTLKKETTFALKTKKKFTRNIIIYASIIIVAAVAVFFIINNLSTKSQYTPEKVAEKFLNHLNKKEFAEAKKLATPGSAALIDVKESFVGDGEIETKEAIIVGIKCQEEDEKATCDYFENGEAKKIDLVKMDNQWLVDMKKESPPESDVNTGVDTTSIEYKESQEKSGKEKAIQNTVQIPSSLNILGTYSYSYTWNATSGMAAYRSFSINIYKNSGGDLLANYTADGYQTSIDYNCEVKISGNFINLYLLSKGDVCMPCMDKVGDKIISFTKLSNVNLKDTNGDIWTKK